MSKPFLKALAAALLGATLMPAAATGQDDIVTARGWPQFDRARDGDCTAEVRGNGRIFLISGDGFAPDAQVLFHLANGAIVPLYYEDTADELGQWSRYYVPFLWHSDGEIVQVQVASAQCAMHLSFPWTRADPDRTH